MAKPSASDPAYGTDHFHASYAAPRVGILKRFGRLARRKPLGAFSAIVIVVIVFLAISADVVAPYGPAEMSSDRFVSRSLDHPMGTDHFGRDVLSRVIHGARLSLYVGFSVVFGSIVLGTIWGTIAGYFGGLTDKISIVLLDAIIAFPALAGAIALVAILGASTENVILALLATSYARSARVIRSQVLVLRGEVYVEAARAIGAPAWRIMFRHILPNTMAPIIILATLSFGNIIIAEASLSFLGLGPPPPTPAWGRMLSREGQDFFLVAPWLVVWPGIAIGVTVYTFNMFGDALRDVLDPRLRGEGV